MAPFSSAFRCPLPPVTLPSGPTWTPVDQPYVGSPSIFGSAFTTRTSPISWPAFSAASSCPAALRTGTAAAFAAFSLTGSPPGSAGPFAHIFPGSHGVVGVVRANVQVPGACFVTFRSAPGPSSSPTTQDAPSVRGEPGMPSAFASRATSADATVPFAWWTAASSGPSGRSPSAR
ncbi:hypothetical protein SFIMM107S_04525 [Streptomyces griseus]